MSDLGSFQTLPRGHRLSALLLMIAAGLAGFWSALVGSWLSCLYLQGEILQAQAGVEFWVRAEGYAILAVSFTPILVAIAALAWLIVGATTREIRLGWTIFIVAYGAYLAMINTPLLGVFGAAIRNNGRCGDFF